MSKSEKNFITIKDALSQFTPNQIRFLFLMNRWDRPMNYSPGGETMKCAVEVEKTFNNFFASAKSKVRETQFELSQRWTDEDKKLDELLTVTEAQIHGFLCDNFNTGDAVVTLQVS
eukprot:GHVN01000211.1.p1 GENE.GHVN01000211.1~~GHVN01000211.1.p1  ORF type:complete len:123 (+),score=13.33 GHVN01000211.1:22-369(+)